MKKTFLIILTISWIVFGSKVLLAQDEFEGIVELKTFSQKTGENAQINWFIKGGNHKLEISGSVPEHSYKYNILILENDPSMKMISEQDGETTVFSIPHEKIASRNKAQKSEVVRTKETKFISGYECRLVKIMSDSLNSECWVSSEISLSTEKYPVWLKSNPVYGVLSSNGIKGFPMEIETLNAEGVMINSVKVQKVVATKLNSSEFELPASYIDGEQAIKESLPK